MQGIDGFGFFSSKHFFRPDLESFDKKLQKKYLTNPSLVPEMPWIDKMAPAAPVNLRKELNRLEWDTLSVKDPMDENRFFVIYYSPEEDQKLLKSGDNIIGITGEIFWEFEDEMPAGIFRVSALDRMNNESPLSEPFENKKEGFWHRIFN
ncbi:MAG: hypothetical protein ACP5E3_09450, partial [Bacteroidales bacterium]